MKISARYAIEVYKDSVLLDTICYVRSFDRASLIVECIKSYNPDYELKIISL